MGAFGMSLEIKEPLNVPGGSFGDRWWAQPKT